uniref:Uncharacterized protein n=1 Tax=Rhizophora mucronata TaxID=61149 RepID=A0A2P2P9F6_RHIMU
MELFNIFFSSNIFLSVQTGNTKYNLSSHFHSNQMCNLHIKQCQIACGHNNHI